MSRWRTSGDLLALAVVCTGCAWLLLAGFWLVGFPPEQQILPPGNQTPIPWATARPEPTRVRFAPHGSPAPIGMVKRHCEVEARPPYCAPTAVPYTGSLVASGTMPR